MLDLSSQQAVSYFADRLRVHPHSVSVTALGGGVSNDVVLVEAPSHRAVAKQSLEKLRVEQDWFCPRERIFHEARGLEILGELLPEGSVPRVLWEDQDNFLFVMEAAPPGSLNFKTELLGGRSDVRTAKRLGLYLGRWVARTAGRDEFDAEFGGLDMFDRLRLDPYYRATALRHSDLAGRIEGLIKECQKRRVALTHGDFSPKNVLCFNQTVWLLDMEVMHYGDPSFDAAFMSNHFLLKAFHRPANMRDYRTVAEGFWEALRAELPKEFAWLEAAAMRHLGVLLLARIDGKSPVEYIREEDVKQHMRRSARALIFHPAETVEEAWERVFR